MYVVLCLPYVVRTSRGHNINNNNKILPALSRWICFTAFSFDDASSAARNVDLQNSEWVARLLRVRVAEHGLCNVRKKEEEKKEREKKRI